MIPVRVYLYAALVAALSLGAWRWHSNTWDKAVASVQAVNNKAIAESNAKAVDEWKKATAAQLAIDVEQRKRDQATDVDTAQAIRDIGDKYAKLAAKPVPKGRCDLSREWIKQYNEAR